MSSSSDKPLRGFDHRFGHSESPDKKNKGQKRHFFLSLIFLSDGRNYDQGQRSILFQTLRAVPANLGLLRLKSVPFLAVKRPLEQAKRRGSFRHSVRENIIRVESHGDNYFAEDVSEVDVGANDVIAFINLSD
jgi:hypothetical protein